MIETIPSFSRENLSNGPRADMLLTRLGVIFAGRWIRSIIRVWKDAHARSNKTWFQIVAVLLVTITTPVLGLPLYRLLRPMTYKKQIQNRQQALLLSVYSCIACGSYSPEGAKHCQNCGAGLQTKCRECKESYSKQYKYCTQCGAPNIDMID